MFGVSASLASTMLLFPAALLGHGFGLLVGGSEEEQLALAWGISFIQAFDTLGNWVVVKGHEVKYSWEDSVS